MIYFDNAATTKINNKALNVLNNALLNDYGNPSTHYSIGVKAHKLLEYSRNTISGFLKCQPENIVFTSGGTESNNIAIQSYLRTLNASDEVICSSIEHSSILNIFSKYKFSCKIIYINPNSEGIIDPKTIISKITSDTKLIILQFINNELGTIQPIQEICNYIKNKKINFHVDAVQAVGHIDINLFNTPITSLSASAHKFNGPKGIGFLYKKNVDLSLIYGGEQERGIRPGTENVPSILAMATALEENCKKLSSSQKAINEMINFLEKELSLIPQIKFNAIHEGYHSILNFQVIGISNEALINYMDLHGICISAGSACDGKNMSKSHVLKAIGLNDNEINYSIRISLSSENTLDECKIFLNNLKTAIEKLS